jgi:hypothetical protein
VETINKILDFIGSVFLTTLGQLVWLLGLIFVFGLILYLLARFTRLIYVKTVGQKFDIVATGWIGTPVHELGHAIFCILFRHKITDIKLYDPDTKNGTIGYVKHSYKSNSLYQRIGNFFIGIGPILFGSLVLYAALYFLMPNFQSLFQVINKYGSHIAGDIQTGNIAGSWSAIKAVSVSVLGAIFNSENLTNWRFWVFIYLSFCIASHMELSPPDISGSKSGLITIVLFLLIFNLIIMSVELLGWNTMLGGFWQYIKLETYSAGINKFLGILGALFIYSVIISALNFVLSYIILGTFNLMKGKGVLNPFW